MISGLKVTMTGLELGSPTGLQTRSCAPRRRQQAGSIPVSRLPLTPLRRIPGIHTTLVSRDREKLGTGYAISYIFMPILRATLQSCWS